MDQLGRGWNAGCSGSPTGPGPTTWQRQAHESGGSRKRRVRVRWGHQSGRKKSGPRGKPPPGRGRCNFDTIRGSPASSTLTPKPGALQGWSGAPIIPTAGVHWPGTAPTRARHRSAPGLPAGTARNPIPRSVYCPTAWQRGCRGRSQNWKRWLLRSSRRRV